MISQGIFSAESNMFYSFALDDGSFLLVARGAAQVDAYRYYPAQQMLVRIGLQGGESNHQIVQAQGQGGAQNSAVPASSEQLSQTTQTLNGLVGAVCTQDNLSTLLSTSLGVSAVGLPLAASASGAGISLCAVS